MFVQETVTQLSLTMEKAQLLGTQIIQYVAHTLQSCFEKIKANNMKRMTDWHCRDCTLIFQPQLTGPFSEAWELACHIPIASVQQPRWKSSC